MSYITFQEYTDNGGKQNESTFNYLVVDAESKLNYYTNNRLIYLEKLPTEIVPLLVRIINIMAEYSMEKDSTLTSYSNGVESISYGYSDGLSRDASLDNKLFSLTNQFIGKYGLTYRGGKFNEINYNLT